MKYQVDFYADGFRSGVIEIPFEEERAFNNFTIKKKWQFIIEMLVNHLPVRNWEMPLIDEYWDEKKGRNITNQNWIIRNQNTIILIKINPKE